jgi:hypothetical protein
VSYTLKSGEDVSDAAFEMLGDRRLVNELHVVNGIAFLRGEKAGPPAKWAAAPPRPDRGKTAQSEQ